MFLYYTALQLKHLHNPQNEEIGVTFQNTRIYQTFSFDEITRNRV